jgi:hypothetical protein
LASAFSIKKFTAIRQLQASSFLGGKMPEAGGKVLFDGEKKVNVHFLLGTHKELAKLKERRKNGERVLDDVSKTDSHYLRWLVVKALRLRVINKTELSRGQIEKRRLLAAMKSNKWSLTRAANLAAFSDDEGQDDGDTPELKFKTRQKSFEVSKEEAAQAAKNLRTHVARRQANISASTSHNVDLNEMEDRLTAPSFSFDWENKLDDDDDDNFLEVDIPAEAKLKTNRDLFLEQLQRSASCNQARGLTRRARSTLNLNSFDSAASSMQDDSQPQSSAPNRSKSSASVDGPSVTFDASSEVQQMAEGSGIEEKVDPQPISRLWENLEASGPSPLMEKILAKQAAAAVESARSPEVFDAGQAHTDEGLPLGQVQAQSPRTSAADALDGCPSDSIAVSAPGDKADVPKVVASDALPQSESLGTSEHSLQQNKDPMPEVESAIFAEPLVETCDIGESGISFVEPSVCVGPMSPDWQGITPTAMWVTESTSFDTVEPEEGTAAKIADDQMVDPAKDQQLEISPTMPMVAKKEQDFEISPTAPMVPSKEQQPEISPTMPMVSSKEQQLEISPTLPMVLNQDEPPAISPTMPMVISEDKHLEISPTMPMVPNKDEPPEISTSMPMATEELFGTSATFPAEASNEGSREPLASIENSKLPNPASEVRPPSDDKGRSILKESTSGKHSTSALSDDSLSDSQSEDLVPGEDQHELQLRQDPKQRLREREWLRHKRRAARQEAGEAMAKVRKRRVTDSQEVSTSTMTVQERSRYESVVVADSVAALGVAEHSKVVRLVGSSAAEDTMFAGFGGGFVKKKSFLMR